MPRTQGRKYRRSFVITGGFALLTLILVSAIAIFLPTNTTRAAASFVTRCGIHFCLDGKSFYYAGANSYDVFTYGDGSSTATQDDIETKFMDKTAIDAHFTN